MDEPEITRELADVELSRAESDGDGRSVTMRLLRWGEVANTPEGPETFLRGAFRGADASSILIESQSHDGDIVGRGEVIEEDGEGPYLRARISRTSAGDDLLTLVGDGLLRAASVKFKPITTRRRVDGVLERARAELRRVAILPHGAYPGGEVLAVRSEYPMSEDVSPAVTPPPDLSPIFARLDSVDAAIASVSALASVPPVTDEPIYQRHATLGEAWSIAAEDPEERKLLQRALADQITSANPGLVHAGWLSSVAGIVNFGRRSISAFGGPKPLPAEGMSLNWPKVKSGLTPPHIGVQATEKTQITTSVVSFDSAAAAIATYAGGSDVSLQMLRRESISYRDAYTRFMLAEWSKVTDLAFLTALLAGGTGTAAWDFTADTDGSAFVAMLFSKSVAVEAATGQPASVVVAASNVFLGLATKSRIVPPTPVPSSAIATAEASSLQMQVSGLRIVHDPLLTAGKFIVSNEAAASWHEEGSPFTIEGDDVAKLGRNIAFWSMGATAIYAPTGVVVGTATGTLPTGFAADEPEAREGKASK